MDDCDNAFARCIMTTEVVEVHTRPDKKSPVLATFKGGGFVYIRDRINNWDFLVSKRPAYRDNNYLYALPEGHEE
jgi:hypothetical protein